ncbi:hypothetical protein DCAR_0310271 [Daucus carota subsp. sativus]|uniref:non-specific serine/threonine protein kinase n=3 Tax=Daucus carota subsp. sativus TaxID=79200 RepID=A0AAF0WM80_DAUCS|nr:hypothetical protein DCAR_0310271 [Daucus carota subsp. sativus]
MIFTSARYIILLILLLATSRFVYSGSNFTDQQALLFIKDSITSDPLGVLSSWNNSIHFCHWKGVTCSPTRQRVTSLNLSSQHLAGTLSPHIGNLSFLRNITLSQNDFRGSIPNEIGRLFRLQSLSLLSNFFQGEFPANLSQCVNIRRININDNNLEGELPTKFASWPRLYEFDLGNNHFTGSIPPSIGNISSIHVLSLEQNRLTGSIPLEVSHHTKLKVLVLSENKLKGMFPTPLYNISSLYTIDVTTNELKGTFPKDLAFTLPGLTWFYTSDNSFSGPLPQSITNASNLVDLDVGENNIAGPVPMNFGSLHSLVWLNLASNSLGYNQPPDDLSFFESLVNCTNLKELALGGSGLKGKLPESVVNLSTTIEILDMSVNYIYGSIPREIGKLVNIMQIVLKENLLTGPIPDSVGELSQLGFLDLGENQISGVIPTSIGNSTRLVTIILESNMLEGIIPTELFNITTLSELYLASNVLRGVIPEQIVGVSAHCVSLSFSFNRFTGALPSSIGSLKQLAHLYVSNNKLTGDIPATLGNCVMLEDLDLAENHFEGKIPSIFRALKNLAFLDLSSNNMSGSIPSFFTEFRLIEFLNLSHNKLGGEVPKEGLFSNVSAFSVTGNLWLCGGIHSLQLPSCPPPPIITRNKKKTFTKRIVLILVLLPLAMLFACLAFWFYRRQKFKLTNIPVSVLRDDQYPRVSYQDLLLATNEFSPDNLLGEGSYGSVYKGVLQTTDQVVAVKVLKVEVRGAKKSFLAECETLRNIRHRNLIKIITACSSIDYKGNDFKALVFEFKTNESVDKWLHPSPSQGSERNLTLLQRVNISIDVALGVDYLHNHSHTKIIHRDIKPSNILLDEEFVAHVGDFGLARFSLSNASDINQTQTSSTGVQGTVGYVPPEYGMGGEISTEGDVYSYGIFLLEMFSGKRPTCSSIVTDNVNNLHDYVRKALPERVTDIADPRIILDQEDHGSTANQSQKRATLEVCLALIFEVGILCSLEMPRERMNITAAVKQLYTARDKLLDK